MSDQDNGEVQTPPSEADAPTEASEAETTHDVGESGGPAEGSGDAAGEPAPDAPTEPEPTGQE